MPAAFIITYTTILSSDLEIQLQTIQESQAPKCDTDLESFAQELRHSGMFAATWKGGRRSAVWDLLNSGIHLLGSRTLADVREGLCCLQHGHNTVPTQDPPWQNPHLRVCLPQGNAMLLEQAQSTVKHGTRRTSCLLCASNRKQALTLEMFLGC